MRPVWWRCRKVGWEKTSHRWHLTFYASNLWRRREAGLVCTNYNYTWAKSKGPSTVFHYDGEKKTVSPVRAGRFHKAFGDKVLFYPAPLFLILWYQRDERMKGTQRHSKFFLFFQSLQVIYSGKLLYICSCTATFYLSLCVCSSKYFVYFNHLNGLIFHFRLNIVNHEFVLCLTE